MMKRYLGAMGALAAVGAPAMAQTYNCPNITCNPGNTGRQVTISGATLFRDFFGFPSSTNDYVDVDQDGCFQFNPSPAPPCFPNVVDQLAPSSNFNGWWIVQNRAVGSVNGLNEFVSFQLCCDTPEAQVTDLSYINGVLYANASGPVLSGCTADVDNDGINNGAPNGSGTGTPVCPCAVDIAVLDVPGVWGTQGPVGASAWNRKPAQAGYGASTNLSAALANVACASQRPGPLDSLLATLNRPCVSRVLNTNIGSPDDSTIYDTPVAFVAIPVCANRGTGLRDVTFTQVRWLLVTGRMPTGENLAAATRDAGSGTRNAYCNSFGVDPSWGNGDNRGGLTDATARTNLGPCHRVTNCGSSSHMQNAVKQRRLAVGYAGISGASGSAADAVAGNYELLNVIKDTAGGTQAVRPTVTSIVHNCDVNTGWQVGGPETFVTRGDPKVSSPRSPLYNPSLPQHMDNENAADYIYNITASVAGFEACSGCTSNDLMPGQALANTFFLVDAQDCRQALSDPALFNSVAPNPILQTYVLTHNDLGVGRPPDGIVTPDFGSVNKAGLVPNRGSSYQYRDAGGALQSIVAAAQLALRNRIQGDFLYDGLRNTNDIPRMMQAFAAGATNYQEAGAPLPPPAIFGEPGNDAGGQVADVIIVDVIGDFDGNGVFDADDIRYFADGLAINPGTSGLDRATGFTLVDTNWTVSTTGHPAGNFFNTTITDACGNSRPYSAGASRFDVAGSSTGPAKGDAPIGANGIVNEDDFCYVWHNQGDWHNRNDASTIDLSCDMNGDLIVDIRDVKALCEQGWGRCFGDIDCNGQVDINDLTRLLGNFGRTSGVHYTEGDMNCDGRIDINDLALMLGNFGGAYPNCI